MTADVTETERFDLPIEEVFDYLVDFSNLAEWDPAFDTSRALDEGAVRKGSRFEVVMSIGNSSVPILYTVERYDRPLSARLVGHGDGFTSTDDMTLRELEPGVTELRWDATVETDAALVDTLATPVFKLVAKASMAGLRDQLDP